MSHYLAIDLGAESGRAMLGSLSGGRLSVEELHRFPNTPVRVPGALYWDTLRLWHEIQHGIAVATRERKLTLDGIGIDTWGVDYGLLGADGLLLDTPRHYRDARTNGVMRKLFETVPRDQVFGYTGIQFMQLNTLFQLYAMQLSRAPALGVAARLLNIPDLFNYWLTGVAKSETTIASTTQFFNPESMTWAAELLERLKIPTGMLCPIVPPGTLLGKMLDPPHAPVYATAGHDTAAAVVAVPAGADHSWCYISSGTWSLMGLELDRPVINAQSLAANYTNEVGVSGKIRFLKNIAGLWLLQECRKAWMLEGREYTYEQLARLASEARPFTAAIDPDAFLEPGGMPEKIAAYCNRTRAGAAGHRWRICALYPGEPGAALPQRDGEPGNVVRSQDRRNPHCGRRLAQHAAQSICGGLYRPPCGGGPERGHRDRQYTGSGDGGRRAGQSGRSAVRGAQLL